MNKDVSTLPGYMPQQPPTGTPIFSNWVPYQTGSGGWLYRSSQPYYNGADDTGQVYDAAAIQVLHDHRITMIVSLNHHGLLISSAQALADASIFYHHIPLVDFGYPTVEQLIEGCDYIQHAVQNYRNVLVYCGFGAGRTGTIYSAYQMCNLSRTAPTAAADAEKIIDDSTAETNKQQAVLRLFGARRGLTDHPADEL